MTPKYRLLRTFVLLAIGLAIGAVIGGTEVMMKNKPAVSTKPPLMDGAKIGGSFTLIDQDGKVRTEKDFADTYKLVYFGFTYCPAICPTELQKTAEALRDLPENLRTKIQPLFITIDPERDTVAVMKNYVPLFSKDLIGLTGSLAQIEAIKKAYKIYGAKVPQDDTYTMDHSSYIYFMSPDDKPIYLFRTTDTADTMVETLTAYFATKP